MEVTVKKATGPSGIAQVRKLKNSITVAFVGGDTYQLDDITQVPASFENGEYLVTLSSDFTKIFGLRPTQGSYVMDWVEIGNKMNGIPDTKLIKGGKLIRLESGQSFVTKDQLVWYVDLAVNAPGHRFDGLKIRHQLPYIFVQAPGTKFTMISGTKKEIERLESFLRAFGMDISSVVIPDGPHSRVLSFLDEYMSEHKRPAYITLNEKGYVDTVSLLPDQLLPKKKSTTKKAK